MGDSNRTIECPEESAQCVCGRALMLGEAVQDTAISDFLEMETSKVQINTEMAEATTLIYNMEILFL